MTTVQLVFGVVSIAFAIVFGAATTVLRKRKSLPVVVRVVPYLLALAIAGSGTLLTVVALMGAFAAVEHADPASKSRLLAQGISEAMNWTAYGVVFGFVFGLSLLVTELVTYRRRSGEAR